MADSSARVDSTRAAVFIAGSLGFAYLTVAGHLHFLRQTAVATKFLFARDPDE